MNWTDSRLVWNNSNIEGPLEVDPKLVGKIWTPDLYFLNEKEAIVHDVTVMNNLMHIYHDGNVHTSTRISMTLSCDMHLERYPHDEQTCSIYAGSYSYSKENVVFHWHSEYPLQLRPTLTLPRFTVRGHATKDCEIHDFGEGNLINGNFSCIQADFYLRRQFGYYIAQVYIPSVLIVVLSWVSFWIDIDAIPARVSLGLLTVLAITTQSTGEKSGLPRVSYIKALDLWMAVCLMFVFMALLEFSYVNVQCRVQKRRQETILIETAANPNRSRNGKDVNDLELRPRSGRRFVFFRDRMKVQRARFVDKCSRVVFPGLFVLFNVGYWLYYSQD
ncbi:glycine receptor subunit alpha-2 [Elysia marginata]|uniref:Glycine receptor subunit alpha-2 n=1 Tax=Elysia marginata TaxID=1093978 RepID=A0AAV4FA00_9GAST|nr:glycine receptor subunit alpha-2 [Elysia marginata]